MLSDYEDVVINLVEGQNYTHLQVSEYLKCQFGQKRGFGECSVRLFCKRNGIAPTGRKHRASDATLVTSVSSAIAEVGPSYGRKMMNGFLASRNIHAGESRVGRVLKELHAPYHVARQQGCRNFNPLPYHAEYFGHKLHMDQNEKLVMFGVVHVLAVDGYSSKIVAWKSMPVKNNLTIYDTVFRKAVHDHGMWDQVRVDHGTEFYLTLYMQEKNSDLRRNVNRQPYIQTESKRNHTVERLWPEVNQRFNYPIKSALISLVDNDSLNIDDDIVKFCVSNLCCRLAEIGVKNVVESWNSHRIPGKGIPNELCRNCSSLPVDAAFFPEAAIAAQWYSVDLGSVLSAESCFGRYPFSSEADRQQCETLFSNDVPNLDMVLTSAVNGDPAQLQFAVLRLIQLVNSYA